MSDRAEEIRRLVERVREIERLTHTANRKVPSFVQREADLLALITEQRRVIGELVRFVGEGPAKDCKCPRCVLLAEARVLAGDVKGEGGNNEN